MPTIKQPPKLLLITLAILLAFWGVSSGSALASTGEAAPVDPPAADTTLAESPSTDAAPDETAGESDQQETETGSGTEQEASLDEASDIPLAENAPLPENASESGLAALGADEGETGTDIELRAGAIPVADETELQQAMWDIPISTTGTVELQNDITVANTITVPFNRTITLTSKEGSTFTITQTTAGKRILKVDGGSATYAMDLTLENIVLDGNNIAGGVIVSGKNGKLTLGQGAVVKNGSATDAGGGVRVESGSLVLAGGSILDNETSYSAWQDSSFGGGGVHLKGGTFTMSSGTINGNTAKNGGGVNLTGEATFTMTGGAISNNVGTVNQGGGVLVAGGSTFTMSGLSVIENNEADRGGGVDVMQTNSKFVMDGGTIRANIADVHGGGVLVNGPGTFTMNGGVIGGDDAADANTATDGTGGGVGMYSDQSGSSYTSTFIMTGDSLIKGNAAQSGGGLGRYNSSRSVIEMHDNATIAGNSASYSGGGAYVSGDVDTTFDMYDASSIHHNTAGEDGGGVDSLDITFTMHNTSSIHHNSAAGWGGGAAQWSNALFTMNDESSIYNNETTSSGGGIAVTNRGGLVMNDNASVVDNTAAVNGGGIFTEYSAASSSEPTSFTMNGGTVARNTALGSAKGGGGIFFDGQANKSVTLAISGDSVIVDNSAPNGHGGGIYSNEPYWGQMVIGPDTVFDRNTASAAYIPPSTVFTDYPSIEFASISIGGLVPYHPLNNYDINFTGGTPTSVYRVTYHGNGNDGGNAPASQLYAAGATVTVSDRGTLTLTDHDFLGWNTDQSETDAEYEAAETFSMPAHDVDLYAIWKATPPTLYTVTYHGNGHDSGEPHPSAQYAAGVSVTVLDKNTLDRTDYEFLGWHTDPTSMTALHSPADTFTMPANDVDLYAIWKAKDTPNPGDPGTPDPGNPDPDPSDPSDPSNPPDPGKPGSDQNLIKPPNGSASANPSKMVRTGDGLGIAFVAAGTLTSLVIGAGALVLARRRHD